MAVINLGLAQLQVGDSITIVGTTIKLVNDSAAPGNEYYYGTDGAGAKGWLNLTGISVAGVALTGAAAVAYTDTRVAVTGLANVSYTDTRAAASGLAGVNYTDTRVAATGQAAWTAGQDNAINLSGKITATGVAAVTYTDTRAAATGLANVNYTDVRAAATGLAGVNYTDARAAATGLAAVNYTDARAAASGLAGVNYTDSRVAASGQAAWNVAQNNAVNLSGNATATGVALIQRDLDISGALQTQIGPQGITIAYSGTPEIPIFFRPSNPIYIVELDVSGNGSPASATQITGYGVDGLSLNQQGLSGADMLTFFELSNATFSAGTVLASNCLGLKRFSFPELRYSPSIQATTNPSLINVSLPNLEQCGAFSALTCASLPELYLPRLTHGTLTLTSLNILQKFEAPLLEVSDVGIVGCPSLTGIVLPRLRNVDDFSINSASTGLTWVELTGLQYVADDISVGGLTSLSHLIVGSSGVLKSVGSDATFSNNVLDGESVSGILKTFASLNGLNGTINFGAGQTLLLNGGTNFALVGEALTWSGIIAARGATVRAN